MSTNEITKGSVVRLKSGGPKMTLSAIKDNGEVYCQWFNVNTDELHCDYFIMESLDLCPGGLVGSAPHPLKAGIVQLDAQGVAITGDLTVGKTATPISTPAAPYV